MPKLRKILVPTDFSKTANRAIEYAVKLAEVNKEAELILLTVIGDLALSDEEMVMLRVSVDSIKEHNQRKIEAAKEKLQKLIRPSTVKRRVQFMVRDGKPYAEIIRAAKDNAVDLIVMSSHGHGRLAEIFLGSTTVRVVQKAPCSVLVVRDRQRAFQLL
jgi:nucleotide-binding universal stress UspA family protein